MQSSDSMFKPDRPVTRSFRISEPTMRTIEEEATEQGLSVNTLVNQLLTKYAKVDRLIAKTKGIRLTHETIKEIFDSVPEDKVIEVARKTGRGITHNNEILALTGSSAAER